MLKAIGLVMPLRPALRPEAVGLDVGAHGEEAYTTGDGAILVLEGGARAAKKEAA